MAASKTGFKISILAEDHSDVEVISMILRKIAPMKRFSVRPFVGNGCGRLRNKCAAWSLQAEIEGCKAVIIVHDQDKKCSSELRQELEAKVKQCRRISRIIVIPVEEIEAWLLADPRALRCAFSLKKEPKCPNNPESISDPKEKLEGLVWRESSKTKRYVNAIHNVRIAKHLDIACLKKCRAFQPLEAFWRSLK